MMAGLLSACLSYRTSYRLHNSIVLALAFSWGCSVMGISFLLDYGPPKDHLCNELLSGIDPGTKRRHARLTRRPTALPLLARHMRGVGQPDAVRSGRVPQ